MGDRRHPPKRNDTAGIEAALAAWRDADAGSPPCPPSKRKKRARKAYLDMYATATRGACVPTLREAGR